MKKNSEPTIKSELENNDYSNEDIDARIFARQIAKAFMVMKSSHCYFIFQVAFGQEKDWEDVEKVCNKIIEEL